MQQEEGSGVERETTSRADSLTLVWEATVAAFLLALVAPWTAHASALRMLHLAPLAIVVGVANRKPFVDHPLAVTRWSVSLGAALTIPVWGAGAEQWGARAAEVCSAAMLIASSARIARSLRVQHFGPP